MNHPVCRSATELRETAAWDDVQSLVLHNSRHGHAVHWVLQFKSPEGGRALLNALQQELTPAWGAGRAGDDAKPEIAIGLTFRGLEALHVPDAYLQVFRRLAPAFAEGAAPRAGERLGDAGDSAPARWDPAFAHRDAHALLTLHGGAARPVCELLVEHCGGVEVLGNPMCGKHLDRPAGRTRPSRSAPAVRERWVHFGYRDGLAGPRIRRSGKEKASNLHEPGELVLGEPRDLGDNPWSLVAAPTELRRFFRHGSFGVLRKIQQFEGRFQRALDRWARYIASDLQLSGRTPPLAQVREFVQAKLCGRWPEGQLVRPHHMPWFAPHGEADGEADFGADADGRGCPFGAHLRRMNPRGRGVALVRPRPLFRRGMPYGRAYEEGEETTETDDARGLLGLFFCSDLEGQFEHLLGEWSERMPLGVVGAGDAKDPLIGAHEDPRAAIVVPRPLCLDSRGACVASEPWRLHGFAPFVQTRGTLYAFYPARAALAQLARSDWVVEEEPWPVP